MGTKAPPFLRWAFEGAIISGIRAFFDPPVARTIPGPTLPSLKNGSTPFLTVSLCASFLARFVTCANRSRYHRSATLDVCLSISGPIKTRARSMGSLTELPSSRPPSAIPCGGYDPAGPRPRLFRARFHARRGLWAGVANRQPLG